MRPPAARAASGRFTPVIHALSAALGNDPIAAMVYQQLFHRTREYADGWVPMSERRLAGEIPMSRHDAQAALDRLVNQDVVEREKGSGNQPDRYLVRQGVLRELLPHDASPQPQFVADSQPLVSRSERDRGGSPFARAGERAKEVRSERGNEGRSEGLNDTDTGPQGSNEARAPEPEVSGEEKDPEHEQPPSSPAGPERSEPRDGTEGNGSGEVAKVPEPYPPELQDVIDRFPSLELEIVTNWRTRLGKDLSEGSMGALRAFCAAVVGSGTRLPLKPHEAAARTLPAKTAGWSA